MKTIQALGIAFALLASGCNLTASGGAAGGQLTVEQCRSYYTHIYALEGTDFTKMFGEEGAASEAKLCSEGAVTRRHFDCAMAAQSVDALQSCGPPNT